MVRLNEEQQERARRVARKVAGEYGLEEAARRYADRRYTGGAEGATVVHLEDVSGIPFISGVPGVEEYQHRARVRAGDGDVFAAVTPPQPGYEAYNRRVLGIGEPEYVAADPVSGPMAVAEACLHEPTLGRLKERLVERQRDTQQPVVLHPYMAIEAVWELAAGLKGEGVETRVLGPPPPVLWIANDKSRVAEVNARLGRDDLNVETHAEVTPEGMTERLLAMAARRERVALKRTRCASAMGNVVFEAEEASEQGPRALLRSVHRFLQKTEWEGDEEVLVVEWADAFTSPSTQMWLPPRVQGAPRLDGVYEQLLHGEERIFVGSRPSTLPEAIEEALVEASMLVATTFQELGYVGRCSFDFVVTGEPDGEFAIRMIECNGRWGGTSTPMHLVDRLVDGPRPDYIAKDFVHPGLVGASFTDILGAARQAVYRPEEGAGRFIFYNVGPLDEKGKFDVIALGENPEAAREAVEVELPRMLGLH